MLKRWPLLADAFVGTLIGAYGMAELRPLPFAQTALIVGYALVSSLAINNCIKSVFISRYQRTAKAAT